MKETVLVEKVNKYGVRNNGKQYNYSKKYSGPLLQENTSYELEIYTSESGAKYINSVLNTLATTATVDTAQTIVVEQGIVEKAGDVKPEIRRSAPIGRDFDKEARGKTKCALYEAAISSLWLSTSKDDADFKRRADDLVSYFVTKVFE